MKPTAVSIPCLGYNLAADWYESDDNKFTLLIFVGYGSSKARNADFIGHITESAHCNSLVVDLSGHGESQEFKLEVTSPAQHTLEAIACFDWIRSTHPDTNLSVMGTSYGGFIAALLTKYREFNSLILRTPAVYRPEDLYSTQAEIHGNTLTAAYRTDLKQLSLNPIFIQKPIFSGSTLLVVHKLDEVVPATTTDIYQSYFSADRYTANGLKHAYSDAENPEKQKPDYESFLTEWLVKTI